MEGRGIEYREKSQKGGGRRRKGIGERSGEGGRRGKEKGEAGELDEHIVKNTQLVKA